MSLCGAANFVRTIKCVVNITKVYYFGLCLFKKPFALLVVLPVFFQKHINLLSMLLQEIIITH